MRLASAADFESPEGLYWNPSGAEGYRRYPFFAERVAEIRTRFPASTKVLVAGCGWGFLLDEAAALGVEAWGMDASSYAISKAQEVLAEPVRSRVVLGDVTNEAQVNNMRNLAGMRGQQKFDLCITEDLLPVLTDAEVATALPLLRNVSSFMLHIITCSKADDGPTQRHPELNWKLQSEWKALVSPDLTFDAETGEVV